MNTIQEKIFSRLTGDSTLQSLLGGAGRINHALENNVPKKPGITYRIISSVPGTLNADNVTQLDQLYEFLIFADNYNAVVERIYRLFQQQHLADTSDTGPAWGIWDWTGPDEFDEELKCGRKATRFRFFVVPEAQAPI